MAGLDQVKAGHLPSKSKKMKFVIAEVRKRPATEKSKPWRSPIAFKPSKGSNGESKLCFGETASDRANGQVCSRALIHGVQNFLCAASHLPEKAANRVVQFDLRIQAYFHDAEAREDS